MSLGEQNATSTAGDRGEQSRLSNNLSAPGSVKSRSKERKNSDVWLNPGCNTFSWTAAYAMLMSSEKYTELRFFEYGKGMELTCPKILQPIMTSTLWWVPKHPLLAMLRIIGSLFVPAGVWWYFGFFMWKFCGMHVLFPIGTFICCSSIIGKTYVVFTSFRNSFNGMDYSKYYSKSAGQNALSQLQKRTRGNSKSKVSQAFPGNSTLFQQPQPEGQPYVEQPFYTVWKLLTILERDNAYHLDGESPVAIRSWIFPKPLAIGMSFFFISAYPLCGMHWHKKTNGVWNDEDGLHHDEQKQLDWNSAMGTWFLLSQGLFFVFFSVWADMSQLTSFFIRSADALACLIDNLEIFEFEHLSSTSVLPNRNMGGGMSSGRTSGRNLHPADPRTKSKRIDWVRTTRNFTYLHDTVKEFSSAWLFFFFVAEFCMVLGQGPLFIACYFHGRDAFRFVSDFGVFTDESSDVSALSWTQKEHYKLEYASGPPLSILILRTILALLPFSQAVVWCLWCRASRITQACTVVRERAAQTLSELSAVASSVDDISQKDIAPKGAEGLQHGSAPLSGENMQESNVQRLHQALDQSSLEKNEVLDDLYVAPSDVAKGLRLCAYMKDADSGFSAYGWTISFGLAMNILYPVLTAVVGILLPALLF